MTLVSALSASAHSNTGRLRFVAANLAAGNYAGLRELRTNWFLCNGAVLSNTGRYAALYAMVGTKFGAAGTLPTILDGRVPIPKGNINFPTIGVSSGEINHVLTLSEYPSHYHTYSDHDATPGGSLDVDPWQPNATNAGAYKTSNSAGGGGSHNNMPPYRVFGCVLVRL